MKKSIKTMSRNVFEIEKIDKVFICRFDGCGKKFEVKGNLQTHMRVHVIIL